VERGRKRALRYLRMRTFNDSLVPHPPRRVTRAPIFIHSSEVVLVNLGEVEATCRWSARRIEGTRRRHLPPGAGRWVEVAGMNCVGGLLLSSYCFVFPWAFFDSLADRT
jgi:hypothetical protein